MLQRTVVVGMSGGVDSSVCALLLKQQGYHVIGLFMKNWEEKTSNGMCQSVKDYEDVVKVCEQIDIPCYTVNFVKEYQERVFSHFLEELKQGHTPNPDILCNREIKFKIFFDKAMSLGADYLATGHYCQISDHGGSFQLLKGADMNKDQSYFVYTIQSTTLSKVLFPIGGLKKVHVREIAKEYRLSTFDKKDSTGICFIGKRNFKEFVGQYLAYKKGDFENLNGDFIGRHDGIAYYTIGQRKGLGIGGPGDAWFVVGKDPQRNVVFVEQGADHPALYTQSLVAIDPSWVCFQAPPTPFSCSAKVRYRQADQPCVIERIEGAKVCVRFLRPQRAVTPRQAIVFYDGLVCLGGAVIS
jgi:tRNA-specific 2-thiouridylase